MCRLQHERSLHHGSEGEGQAMEYFGGLWIYIIHERARKRHGASERFSAYTRHYFADLGTWKWYG